MCREGISNRNLPSKLLKFAGNQDPCARYQVSRRIVRINKRVEKEFGEQIVEKRGWHWALTKFAVDVWGAIEKE
jgi:hypothetical protein